MEVYTWFDQFDPLFAYVVLTIKINLCDTCMKISRKKVEDILKSSFKEKWVRNSERGELKDTRVAEHGIR